MWVPHDWRTVPFAPSTTSGRKHLAEATSSESDPGERIDINIDSLEQTIRRPVSDAAVAAFQRGGKRAMPDVTILSCNIADLPAGEAIALKTDVSKTIAGSLVTYRMYTYTVPTSVNSYNIYISGPSSRTDLDAVQRAVIATFRIDKYKL